MFLTLNFFVCFKISLTFVFVDKRIMSKFFLSFSIISSVDLPIEPVDPKIAIFFSFNYCKSFHNNIPKGIAKIIPSILSKIPPCPGNTSPVSLTLAVRFRYEINKSPA